ncbi:hypothetical protein ZWY2020_028037 [Hordeum vulgare]|nr:hypothetical protein ZWY2020_028037 [Hordeum vulgare]
MARAATTHDLRGAAAANGASGSGKMPIEAMMDLMREMAKLVATPITAENRKEINAELTKLHEEMAKVQREIDVENSRMAQLHARINNELEHLKAEVWQLEHRRSAYDAVQQRRHQTRLPVDLDPARLFQSPCTSWVERDPLD